MNLNDAERQAQQTMLAELHDHLELTDLAYNLISTILNRPIGDNPAPLSRILCVQLLVRLSNDLRTIGLLALTGYTLQAATVAAALLEIAFMLAFIGEDEALADQWARHTKPTRAPWGVKHMIEQSLKKLGHPDWKAQGKAEYQNYSQLCQAKHGNPVLQMTHGWHWENNSVIFMNGPDTSDVSVRAGWFALEKAVGCTYVAIGAYLTYHVPPDTVRQLKPCLDAIGMERKRLEAKAQQRWGTDDPFPGQWG